MKLRYWGWISRRKKVDGSGNLIHVLLNLYAQLNSTRAGFSTYLKGSLLKLLEVL